MLDTAGFLELYQMIASTTDAGQHTSPVTIGHAIHTPRELPACWNAQMGSLPASTATKIPSTRPTMPRTMVYGL
jgi:hypothetical protein